MTNMSTRWLQANFASLYTPTLKWLQVKVRHNFKRTDLSDILHDYYMIASENDRLASRLELSPTGDVVEIKGKEITASRLALFAFNSMLDSLDKSIRHNVDVAQRWSVSNDDDRQMVQFYAAPPSDYIEGLESVIGDPEAFQTVVGVKDEVEDRMDHLDDVELDAVFGVLANLTGRFMKRGKPIPHARESVIAELEGWSSTELAESLGINRGNAREKMVIARQAIDYWATLHREALGILSTLAGGGRIPNADPQLVLLMQNKRLITTEGNITEKGRVFCNLPTVPKVFRESITYYLLT